MGTSESGPLLVQDGDSDSCTASEFSLGTAVEDEGFELFSQSVTSGDTNKSLLTSSSFSPYRRSVSPDTMLQGASSTSSLTHRRSYRTNVMTSDYSSNFSFFNEGVMASRAPANVLVEYWWDLTPQNIHNIALNFLYDADNARCNQCWAFLERNLGVSRIIIFYFLIALYTVYILCGDLARLSYYTLGVAYPMYKSFRTFENHGVKACTGWLRYWVVFGWLALLDVFFHHYLKEYSIYWSFKTLITIYLLMPLVKGADLIYRDFIKDFNRSLEKNIESVFHYTSDE